MKIQLVGRADEYVRMDQTNHEGHSGWTISDLLDGKPGDLSGNLATWMAKYKPDTVVFMA